MDGYRVYRKAPGEESFTLLPSSQEPLAEYTQPHPAVLDQQQPVRYVFTDADATLEGLGEGVYRYYVAPYDAQSEQDGELSNVVSLTLQRINRAPVAQVVPSATSGNSPLTVDFDASGSMDPDGIIVQYAWDWENDGTFDQWGPEPEASHTYTMPGEYTMRLRVADDEEETDSVGTAISVTGGVPPDASIVASRTSGPAPLTVLFDASGSTVAEGTIVEYEWDFEGSGTFGNGGPDPAAEHIYEIPGTYNATVRVTSSLGGVGTAIVGIIVKEYDPGGTWNFMVWIAGDNNLAQAGVDDINEMEAVGSNENIRILVGYDIDPWWLWSPVEGTDRVHFIKVVPDGDPFAINTAGDPANVIFPRAGYNSADPANVVEFLSWAETNFPADHQVLVLWDHGNGWRLGDDGSRSRGRRDRSQRKSASPGRQASGILGDDSDGSWFLTSNHVMAQAFAGRHFEMLLFDGCSMGHIEALYDYRGLADWYVGSEVLVPFDGYPYTEILAAWNAEYPIGGERVGQIAVDEVERQYSSEFDFINHSVFDPYSMLSLVSAMGDLAGVVTAKAEQESEAVKSAISAAFEPWGGDGERDLNGFLSAYRGNTSDPQIQSLIDNTLGALANTVVYFKEYEQPGTTGLAAYLPDVWWFDPELQQEYGQLAFAGATGWLEMLQATGVPGSGGGSLVEANWEPGDKLVIDWGDSLADCDLGILDPNFNWGAPYVPEDLFGVIEFSEDSMWSGLPEEWAILEPGAPKGDYILDIFYFSYDGFPAPTMDVSVKLYDSSGQLKADLGICTLTEWEDIDFARLIYE